MSTLSDDVDQLMVLLDTLAIDTGTFGDVVFPDSVMSNWWGNAILANRFTKYGAWVALHTGDPTPLADPSTEVAGGGYLRQKGTFTAASSKTVATTNKLIWASLPAVTVAYIGLWSAEVGGDMYVAYPLTTPIAVADSSHLVAAAGDIAVTL